MSDEEYELMENHWLLQWYYSFGYEVGTGKKKQEEANAIYGDELKTDSKGAKCFAVGVRDGNEYKEYIENCNKSSGKKI